MDACCDRFDERMAFLKKQIEQAEEQHEADHDAVWDRLKDMLFERGLITEAVKNTHLKANKDLQCVVLMTDEELKQANHPLVKLLGL